ncbi:SDR family NAD(P)-dependent oxidoreductase [Promicromonospora thailandica]|uniref:Ketoreductase domain-containing protein n=1 Tax=Promicromonospora thailandica TaxID=765201 RepID=A0A9X2G4S3_9MICO|nr:SDR family oxidoreductase [Promicromonospora thailandica]MCP2265528.1 hypothetical protein [Promicromonospora thailandica]BFF17091.1 SDR family NAD(P)-dependent oxidoreductase [Promicromonospora thailandica]
MRSYTAVTALITGASKGIGEAFALELAERGADLVLVARSLEPLEKLAGRIRADHGVRVDTIAADLGRPGGVDELTRTVDERGLRIDLLVNNAGMGTFGPFLGRPLGPNTVSVDLNVTALMALAHHFGAAMLERNAGGIINVASAAAFQPMPYQASYGASKAFVLSFTEALAEELRGTGVRVMAAHPGPVRTGFFDDTTATMNPRAVSPQRIATNTLNDFARARPMSFPGGLTDRALATVSRFLPRSTVARLSGEYNRRAGHDQARVVQPSR